MLRRNSFDFIRFSFFIKFLGKDVAIVVKVGFFVHFLNNLLFFIFNFNIYAMIFKTLGTFTPRFSQIIVYFRWSKLAEVIFLEFLHFLLIFLFSSSQNLRIKRNLTRNSIFGPTADPVGGFEG